VLPLHTDRQYSKPEKRGFEINASCGTRGRTDFELLAHFPFVFHDDGAAVDPAEIEGGSSVAFDFDDGSLLADDEDLPAV
jgi:hypothetical protein